jgi:cyclic pyranopterin phosphate synthase
MSKLSHTDDLGKANMVDVGHKPRQIRVAKAKGHIKLKTATIKLIRENEVSKGDVLSIAQFAGIQAAKQTPSLIPLCHPLLLSKVDVTCKLNRDGVVVTSEVKCTGQTGVEMEALTAVCIALLTIYDMCKAVDKEMEMGSIVLIEKTKQDIK